MQFLLDKNQKGTLFEQAREQLIIALHLGRLRSGDRLPSVRQVALRNNINLKTAFAIYQRLRDEGYIEIRTGSGAYVSNADGVDLDQAYCLSILQLIKANITQARQFKIEPDRYLKLVNNFIAGPQLESIRIALVECNHEQIDLFAHEIASRLKVRVYPLMLDQLSRPDAKLVNLLESIDYFATTDFHYSEVKGLVADYKKRLLQVRLNPEFVPKLVTAARQGRLLMIVSDATFFPAFRQSMLGIGLSPEVIDRIIAVDDKNPARVKSLASESQSVYISPICNPQIRQLIPEGMKEIQIDGTLSKESLETLEAMLLFHDQPASTS
jgi:DNA-binding transcriptional regulator YhcF (GntR family)